jgi:hypothetical protein
MKKEPWRSGREAAPESPQLAESRKPRARDRGTRSIAGVSWWRNAGLLPSYRSSGGDVPARRPPRRLRGPGLAILRGALERPPSSPSPSGSDAPVVVAAAAAAAAAAAPQIAHCTANLAVAASSRAPSLPRWVSAAWAPPPSPSALATPVSGCMRVGLRGGRRHRESGAYLRYRPRATLRTRNPRPQSRGLAFQNYRPTGPCP